MRFAFLDTSAMSYVVDTPRHSPLGGTQSAICYLAQGLAQCGHEVFVINRHHKSVESCGVSVRSLEHDPNPIPVDVDVVVVSNHAGQALKVRQAFGSRAKLVFWTGHSDDQVDVGALAQPEERLAYAGFAFVSNWQRARYIQRFGLEPQRCVVTKNAVSPTFENLFGDNASVESVGKGKGKGMVMAYTSTPFRGLELLPEIFPLIREQVPGAQLEVYSGMSVYQSNADQEARDFGELYKQLIDMDGVDYVGPRPQTELAQRLKHVSVLAYPNIFEETSCIAVMEALAAGAHVVTSALGALPETAKGHADFVQPIGRGLGGGEPGPQERARYVREFADACVARLRQPQNERRLQHIARFGGEEVWSARARQWEAWALSLVSQQDSAHHIGQ